MRRVGIVFGVVLVLIIAALLIYLQNSAPATVDSVEPPNIEAIESGSGSPDTSFDIEISGALNITGKEGITNANLREGIDGRPNRREIWIVVAGDWMVVLAFPEDVEVSNYTFDAPNLYSAQTAYVVAPPVEVAPDAIAFQQNTTGYLNITEVEDGLISGEFSFDVSATDGSEVHVEGNFSDVQMAD